MRLFLGGALVGLSLGLIVGLGFASRPAPRTSRTEVTRPPPNDSSDRSAANTPYEQVAPPIVADPGDSDALARALARVAQLERELSLLQVDRSETEARAEARRDAPEAEPIPFPEGLPERFQQESLRRSLDEALTDLGGEVVLADCHEHPCSMVSRLASDDDGESTTSAALLEHPAMAAYADDIRHTYRFSTIDRDGKETRYVAYSFHGNPSSASDPGGVRFLARLRHRTHTLVRSIQAPVALERHQQQLLKQKDAQ